MVKNKFRNKKEKKQLKKFKKNYDEFKKLEKKYEKGDISQKEILQYNNLKKEIEKMAGKYVLKDGKLQHKDDVKSDGKDDVIGKNINQQPQQAVPQPQQPQQAVPQPQQQEEQRRQQIAQQKEEQQEQVSRYVVALLKAEEMPEIAVKLLSTDIKDFNETISKARKNKETLHFGPYHINAEKLIIHRFEDAQSFEKRQAEENNPQSTQY